MDYFIDSSSGLAWYSDLDDFSNKSYDEKVIATNDLNSGAGTFGLKRWRLATTLEVIQMFEMWKSISFPREYFVHTSSHANGPFYDYFWDARTSDHDQVIIKLIADVTGNHVFEVPITIDAISDAIKTYEVSAWVVADMSIPEPTTLILMGTGLIGFLGVVRKTNRIQNS